jgi:hypothetical protein
MNEATTLLRQINPSWIQNGRVTSQAFKPTPKDRKKLSVYDNDKISPQESYEHWTSQLHNASEGVLGVLRSECEELSLKAVPDPEPFPSHALIDFSEFERKAIEGKAKALRNFALQRSWLYVPE